MNIGEKMKKSIVSKIILILFLVSVTTEVAITVGYLLLSNMDTDRFKNEININIIENK